MGLLCKADGLPPPPLSIASIDVDNSISNKNESPELQFYNGPTDIYAVIGDVRFRRLTTSDITIRHAEASGKDLCVELTKNGALTTDIHSFSFYVFSIDRILRKIRMETQRRSEVIALAADNVGKEN
jgi:hypothetical protein